jgi:hypothetical protein
MAGFDVDFAPLRELLLGRSLSQMSDDPLRLTVKSPLRLGSLLLAPSSSVELQVLNRAADKDADEVFGEKRHISFETQRAWLKYRLHATFDGKLAPAAAAFHLMDEVSLCDYRVHAATDGAADAVALDLASPRTLLSLDDLRRLIPGEALTLERAGKFQTTVSVAWADVFTSRLSDIVDGLVVPSALAVRIKQGLEAGVAVTIEDQFALVISRTSEGLFRMSLKKAQSTNHRFSLEASLGAQASLRDAIEEAVEPLLEALTGVASSLAERAARKLGLEPLDSSEQDAVDRLVRHFGLDTTEGRATAVKKAIGSLRRELRERLEKAVVWKASAMLAWEYSRIDESSAIADFVLLDDTLLEHDRDLLLRGDLGAIAQSLRTDTSRRKVVRWLSERSSERRTKGGFDLTFGRWLSVAATSSSRFRITTRTSLDGFQLSSARATYSYEEKSIPQNDFEWVVDFKADMSEFLEQAATSDFDYALQYVMKLERAVLREDDLDRMLDFAAMWNVSAPLPSTLAEAVGRSAKLQLQLRFDRIALEKITAELYDDVTLWAGPLAAAMPWSSNFVERRDFRSRMQTYEDAWTRWLRGEEDAPELRRKIRSGLVLFEERALPGSFAWTSGDGHPHLRRNLQAFLRGCRRLHVAMTNGRPPKELERIVANLEACWTQRLYLAASGRFLLDRAAISGARVRGSLRIDLDEETLVAG